MIEIVHSKTKNIANSQFNKKKEECFKTPLCAGFPDNMVGQTCVFHCMSEPCFFKKFVRSDGTIPEFGQVTKHQEQTFKQCWIDEQKSNS